MTVHWIAVLTDVFYHASTSLRASDGVEYRDLGLGVDFCLRGGLTATGVPAGLWLQDKGLLSSLGS